MSQQKPLVVVVGSTGAQGGSVVDALLKDGSFRVRGITRDANSDKAKKLAERGVEVVAADILQSSTLPKAFEGAWAIFAVTNFWDPSQMGKEIEIGSAMADAAKAAGVSYYVWSSLPNADEISKGKYHVPHLSHKFKVSEYVTKIGLKGIFIQTAFYFQNFIYFFPPKKDEQGNILISMPFPESGTLTGFDVNDTGVAVVGALKNPERYVGKYINLYGKNAPFSDYINEFKEETGKTLKYTELPSDALGAEMGHMFGFFNEYNLFGKDEDFALQKEVNPNPTSWKQWLRASGYGSNL